MILTTNHASLLEGGKDRLDCLSLGSSEDYWQMAVRVSKQASLMELVTIYAFTEL
jgi:hypothetical protein